VSNLTLYTLRQCSTCRAAVKWLEARGVVFTEKAIRETPPTIVELQAMLAAHGGEVRRLFNSSGLEYRALGMAKKLPAMKTEAAIALLAGNGSLVKRPFIIGRGVALVGFDEPAWAKALAGVGAKK
jgi:arsenate reductase (glutaredoxin)